MQYKPQSPIKKVHSIKRCHRCQMICHEGSYRTRLGRPTLYFCNESCAKFHFWEKAIDNDINFDDYIWEEGIKSSELERVDLITSSFEQKRA